MILSMTGFGRGTAVLNGREITVELRSVNSRYFEYSSRIPRTCSSLDSRLKKQLNQRISRGKVELSMTVQNVDAADTVVAVNMELARSYQQAMRDIIGRAGEVRAPAVQAFEGIVGHEPYPVQDKVKEVLSRVLRAGITRFRMLFRGNRSRSEIVATFLAVLELCKGRRINLAGTESDCTVTGTEDTTDLTELTEEY